MGKGGDWSRAVRKVLEGAGIPVSVRGVGYAGDDLRWDGWSGECKNTRSIDLAGFVDQAVGNAEGRIPVVLVKRRGRADAGEGYAVMRISDFVEVVARGREGC